MSLWECLAINLLSHFEDMLFKTAVAVKNMKGVAYSDKPTKKHH